MTAVVGARLASATAARIATAIPLSPFVDVAVPPGSAPHASLAALVELQIIPRLMRTHTARGGLARLPENRITAADLDSFTPLAIASDAERLLAHAEQVLGRGVQVETLLLDLLVPAARRLGAWWEEDRCDFVEVTMGLWRLQQVARELCARMPIDCGRGAGRRRAFFAPVPGDQHSFGALMVDEFFRQHGWDSEADADIALPDLLARVGEEWFDVVGLTVSCDCHIGRLPSIILALRSVSRNPRLRVMIGGRVCLEDSGLAARVGADGTASDARQAVRIAEDLVEALAPAAACA